MDLFRCSVNTYIKNMNTAGFVLFCFFLSGIYKNREETFSKGLPGCL